MAIQLSTVTSATRPWTGNTAGDVLFETDTGHIIVWDGIHWRQMTYDGTQWPSQAIGHADDINYPGGIRAVEPAHQYYVSVQPEYHLDAARVDGTAVPTQPTIGAAIAQWTDRSGNGVNFTNANAANTFEYGSLNGKAYLGHGIADWMDSGSQKTHTGDFTQISVTSNDITNATVKRNAVDLWSHTQQSSSTTHHFSGHSANTGLFPGDATWNLPVGAMHHSHFAQNQSYSGTTNSHAGLGTSELISAHAMPLRGKLADNIYATTALNNQPLMQTNIRNAATHTQYMNGGHMVLQRTSPATFNFIWGEIGSAPFTSAQQFIHESLIFYSALSNTDLNNITTYLTAKWGVGSVTGTSPF